MCLITIRRSAILEMTGRTDIGLKCPGMVGLLILTIVAFLHCVGTEEAKRDVDEVRQRSSIGGSCESQNQDGRPFCPSAV